MKISFITVLFALVPGSFASAGPIAPDPCEYFVQVLQAVPHQTLTRSSGVFSSRHDGKSYAGCEVVFVADDALLASAIVPDFRAEDGSDLFRAGWRPNSAYAADGPGTSLHGIERGEDLCLVSWSQPASIEPPYIEGRGTLVQSETLTIVVQCRMK